MKKRQPFFILLLLGSITASAQQAYLKPEVLASAGSTVTANGASLSYTVGEVAVQTLTASGVSFGQGFHNGVLDIVGSTDVLANWQLSVYPNPASQVVYVEYEAPTQDGTLTAAIWDLQGRQLLASMPLLASAKNALEVQHLPSGIYLLRLSDPDGNHATVKIVKSKCP
jgi:hypothetical protein